MDLKGIFFQDFNTSYIPQILQEIYINRIYDPYIRGKKDLTVMDVGANIGLFSMYAAPFSKIVYAVEPAMSHFMTMKHMFEYNKLTNIFPIKVAMSYKNGPTTFYHNENTTMYSLSSAVDDKKDKGETVECVTIDKLFESFKIDHLDFMKLDVEGEEGNILGSEGFDKVAPKIDIIMGENHSWNSRTPNQIMTMFLDRGFDFHWLAGVDAQVFLAKRK